MPEQAKPSNPPSSVEVLIGAGTGSCFGVRVSKHSGCFNVRGKDFTKRWSHRLPNYSPMLAVPKSFFAPVNP